MHQLLIFKITNMFFDTFRKNTILTNIIEFTVVSYGITPKAYDDFCMV